MGYTAAMTGKTSAMPNAIIHTTVDQLAADLAPYAGDRRVAVQVIDATDEEERARVKQAVDRAMRDPRPSVPAEEVYARALAMIEAKRNAAK